MGEVSTGPNPVSSADEVYRFYLNQFGLDTDGDPVAVALFAFAMVERERIDWVDHCVGAVGQQPPDAAAVRDWYRSKPPAYFAEKGALCSQLVRVIFKKLVGGGNRGRPQNRDTRNGREPG